MNNAMMMVPVRPPLAGPTWDHLINLWKHGRPESTLATYMPVIQVFRVMVRELEPARITLEHLQAYANTIEHQAPRTKNWKLSALKSILGFGHRVGLLPFDVGRALRVRKVADDLAQKILPENDILKMIEREPSDRNHALLRVLYGGGIRASEAGGLQWQDCRERESGGGQITVLGKGDKSRTIRLSVPTWKALQALRRSDTQPTDYVFVDERHHRPLHRCTISNIVRIAAERAGVGGKRHVSAHWMRHGHATHAMERGAPLTLIQQTLGHASIATTQRYLHVNPEESSSKLLKV